jgi:hypothetical protein
MLPERVSFKLFVIPVAFSIVVATLLGIELSPQPGPPSPTVLYDGTVYSIPCTNTSGPTPCVQWAQVNGSLVVPKGNTLNLTYTIELNISCYPTRFVNADLCELRVPFLYLYDGVNRVSFPTSFASGTFQLEIYTVSGACFSLNGCQPAPGAGVFKAWVQVVESD